VIFISDCAILGWGKLLIGNVVAGISEEPAACIDLYPENGSIVLLRKVDSNFWVRTLSERIFNAVKISYINIHLSR
jgi:hypothetical protein